MISGKLIVAKEDSIEISGRIIDVLPSGMFRVDLETGRKILAHLSGRLRIRHIRIVKGDSVIVEMSPYDLTRGRIIRRLRQEAV